MGKPIQFMGDTEKEQTDYKKDVMTTKEVKPVSAKQSR